MNTNQLSVHVATTTRKVGDKVYHSHLLRHSFREDGKRRNEMFHTCKITVLKRFLNEDIVNATLQNPEKMKICDRVEDNQEFFISNPFEMPENICASAWADIRPHIITMATGGTFDFMIEKNSTIATCTDPFRPVIFKIERV